VKRATANNLSRFFGDDKIADVALDLKDAAGQKRAVGHVRLDQSVDRLRVRA
jgi:hypothetical protein